MDKRKRRFWWIKWAALAIVAVMLGTLAVLWLTFQHVPAWYKPPEIAPEQAQAAFNDFTRVFVNEIGNHILESDSPFDYRISQDQINAWLAAREEVWPLSREWLPPAVSNPFLIIDAEGVRVAATVQYGSIQTVLSARLAISADEERVHVRVLNLQAGSLPIPESWLKERLAAVDRGGRLPRIPAENSQSSGGTPSLTAIFDGVSLPNAGTWGFDRDKRSYRVIGLQLEPGAIVATIRPLPDRPRSSNSHH